MELPEKLGFQEKRPLTLKGYVEDWYDTGHHLELLCEGYVPFHWRDSRSFDTDQYEPNSDEVEGKMNNAKGTMTRLTKLSMIGGKVAVRAQNHDDHLFVGSVSPGCLWTGDVSFPQTSMMTMKGFRFDHVAEVEEGDTALATEVIESIGDNRVPLSDAGEDGELIRDLIRELRSAGRL